MSRRVILNVVIAATLTALLLAAAQATATAAPQSEAPVPVSVEAVREGLRRPQTITIPPLESNVPVFRATVEAPLPLDTPLQAMRRELAANPGSSGGSGVDVWPAIMGLVNKVKSAHRAWEEARIRSEVQAEITAFCTEHDCSAVEDGPPPMEGIILPKFKRAR